MTMRIAINGFGRIGRAYLRAVADADDLEVVAVNDLVDTSTLAALLRRDSTFGPFDHEVDHEAGVLLVDGRKIAVTREPDAARLPWAEHGVDLVVESTGRLRTRDAAAAHLLAGARHVVISAPGKGVDFTVVIGVNDHALDPEVHRVVSNASCTTNCVAPMVKVLHEAIGIERAFMTTVHAYTNDQNLLDGPHKDLRRARAAASNIVPTSTGAARAVGEVFPDLAGRIDGVALRVPVSDGSLVDLTARLRHDVDRGDVDAAFRAAAAEGPLAGILHVTDEPFVSSDVIGDPSSCVVDAGLTQADGRMVKVFGWYDNEWGYTARLVDLTRLLSGSAP